VDQKADIESVREAYDAFLSEFPLCYVYWKRYADHEAAAGSANAQDKVSEVYERAVDAFPHSVDLWTYYCTHLVERSADPTHVRSVFERAADKVGTDYLAQSLWDKYLDFELSQKEFVNVTHLYTRVLAVPLEALSKYFERWKIYASAYPVNDILPAEEKEQLAAEESDEAKRAKAIASREGVYQTTQQELAKIQPFENVLREKPYFHVKPVSEELLDTWHKYLTFQESEGDAARTVKLYERCLVPCCNYVVYWRRYARFVEDTLGAEETARVWERATGKLLKHRPEPFLDFALFQEGQGQTDAARELYKHVLGFAPGHVEATLRYAQLEQRQRNFDGVTSILEAALENPKSESVGAFLAMHHARIVDHAAHDADKARDIYNRALERYPSNKNLWLAAIDFENNQSGRSTERETNEEGFLRVVALYQRALGDASLLPEDDKLELWQNYLETVHSSAPRIDLVRQALSAFAKAFPSGKIKSKKRRHDEGTDASAHKKLTRASVLPSPAGPVPTAAVASPYGMGAYAGMGGYGAAATGGYGAYGAYPQAGGYGAWPQQSAGGYPAAAAAPQQAYPGYTGYSGY
jgi:pre-mRNA-processing factor 39